MGRERKLLEPGGVDNLSGMDAVQRLRFRKKEVVWAIEVRSVSILALYKTHS